MDIQLTKHIIQMPTIKKRQGNPYENSRIVPIINDKLHLDLEAYLEISDIQYKPSGYSKLIQGTNNKDGISEVRINQIVADLAEKANVQSPNPNRKNVHPHIFRHSFVRYARKYGMDFKVISQIIGHQSISTTFDLYGTPDTEEIISESQKMANYALD
jgi:site-specific recombinase XerD